MSRFHLISNISFKNKESLKINKGKNVIICGLGELSKFDKQGTYTNIFKKSNFCKLTDFLSDNFNKTYIFLGIPDYNYPDVITRMNSKMDYYMMRKYEEEINKKLIKKYKNVQLITEKSDILFYDKHNVNKDYSKSKFIVSYFPPNKTNFNNKKILVCHFNYFLNQEFNNNIILCNPHNNEYNQDFSIDLD